MLIIDGRFNGPPESANGGYTAGLLAERVGPGAVEVTLRRPPPLDTPLTVDTAPDGTVRLFADGELIAEATPFLVAVDEAVPPVSFAEAHSARARYRGLTAHPFPTCVVCGPDRVPGDGLRLFPGPLPDGRTATSFIAPPEMSRVLVWAALDCPGGWAVPLEARPYVLGRIAARIDGVPTPGDECVVMGRMVGEQGRKAFTQSSLYGPAGALLATAHAVWIALPPG